MEAEGFKFRFAVVFLMAPTGLTKLEVKLLTLKTESSLVLSEGVKVTLRLLPELLSQGFVSHCSEFSFADALFSKLLLELPLELIYLFVF